MHNKQDILKRSIGDFFSPVVLFVNILSFFIAIGLLYIIYLLLIHNSNSLQLFDINIDSITTYENEFIEKINEYPFLKIILEHEIIMFVFHYLFLFGFGVVLYYIFFILFSTLVGFFSFLFVGYVYKKYYPDIELKGMNIFVTVLFYIKTIVITLMLFILLSPMYIIPGLNLFILFPIYYFFHKTVVFDVSSIINNIQEYKQIKKVKWGELKEKTVFCFLLSLIPFLGVIIYPFYIIYISHYIFNETQQLRYAQNFRK